MWKTLFLNNTTEFVPPYVCSVDGGAAPDTSGGGSSGPSASGESSGPSQTPASPGTDSGDKSAAVQTTPESAPSSPSTPAQSNEFDFESFFEAPKPAVGAKTEPPVAPATAGKVQPKPGEAPAPAPAEAKPAPAVQPQPAQAPDTSDQARVDTNDPTSMASALERMRDAAVESIAKQLFPLSQQDLEGLETNAGETIPRLLARVFVVAQTQYLQQMARMVPAMISKANAATVAHAANETAFFKAWPQLNKETHGELIRRVGQVWRAQNPNASLEQAVAEIGPMVAMIAKVPLTAPAARTNGRAPPSQPFVPATPGATVAQQPAAENPFEFLGQQG